MVTAIALVGLVIGGAGTVVVRNIATDSLEREVERERRGVADRLAGEFDARVETVREQLLLLATRGDLVAMRADTAELSVAIRATDGIDELVLHRLDGTPVAAAASDRVVRVADTEARPAVAETLEPGVASISALPGEEPVLEAVAPIENPPGTVVGFIVGRGLLETVGLGLQARFLGPAAQAFFVSDEGRILVHPERDRVFEGDTFEVAEMTIDGSRVATVEQNGTSLLVALAPTASIPGHVVLQQERAEALSAVGDQVGDLTVVLLVVVGSLVLLVALLGTRWLRPLGDLAATLERIGRGERDARAPERAVGELQLVAREVNRMADALDLRMRDLEETQRHLAHAEARFRTAFDRAPVAMALVGESGVYEEVNPALCRLFGRSEEELLSLNWREVTHPDDLHDSERVLDAALRSRDGAYQIEKRYLRADGAQLHVLLSIGVVEEADGFHFIAHIQDLSEMRRAEHERRLLSRQAEEADARARMVLDSAPDATIVVGADGRIRFSNRQIEATFGYTPTELIDQPIEVLLPERFQGLHVAHREGFFRRPQRRSMGAGLELVGRRKDGAEIPIEVSLSPVEVEDGVEVVASVRDVSERLAAEEASRFLEEAERRQRQAMELNDNIVQGLTVAKWAFERERLAEARDAVARTLNAAQSLIQSMLREASAMDLSPGDLVRQRPAEFDA